MNSSGKVITISLGGSIINPGSIDRDFLIQFKDLIIDHVKQTNDKFVIICGGGKVARDYINGGPVDIPPGQKDLLGISATWVNAQLIAAWFYGYTPTKPIQEFYDFVNQLDKTEYPILVAGGFLPSIKTYEDAAICADYFNSPYLLNVTNVEGVYDFVPNRNSIAKNFDHLSYK